MGSNASSFVPSSAVFCSRLLSVRIKATLGSAFKITDVRRNPKNRGTPVETTQSRNVRHSDPGEEVESGVLRAVWRVAAQDWRRPTSSWSALVDSAESVPLEDQLGLMSRRQDHGPAAILR